ncbi:2-oxo-4-hydroxy-4-carboxy-5-ureidoimidazoline decarboxylase [Haloglycomyces albus]|uniref:2-oxo-4-hydroxy-4-carboxy-5-ureidoimidazoline decarboxylase n=1 Tax=Haloglycomyces albus TaxID=526067 RepID=UPI00046D81DA|nr:2-oxo-4-hydroxy-4-carboxy-5-ureidoimidazoline decarboxylase [Haloglycomyces albus]
MWTLAEFNDLDTPTARAELLTCCSSPEWAETVSDARPFGSNGELREFADTAYDRLSEVQIDQAVKAHPEIGERATGRGHESSWSHQEQDAALEAEEETKKELAQVNAEYRERFGHVFLICATGLGTERILAEARRRLHNDPDSEAAEVAAELRKIVRIRLGKLVSR